LTKPALKPNDPSSLLPELPQGAEILIVRPRSLGDIVLETPAIAALHAWRPDLRINVLVEQRFAAALEGNPAIASVIFSRGFVRAARELRAKKFAVVFNQHGGPRSAFLTAASGSQLRVCWKGFQFSFLYNVLVPDAQEFFGTPVVHTVEHRISQFYATGLPRGPIPRAQIFPHRDAMQSVASMLAQKGIAPEAGYAVLQPGARLPSMRWPVTRLAEVARWLRDAHGIASVVNLGAGDSEIAADTRRELHDCAVIADPLPLRELIALVAGARLFIGNDSGPAHLAAATARPSVVIFSSTNPAQWSPWQTVHRTLHTGAVFRPRRGDKTIADSEPRSIDSVGTVEVQKAAEELLDMQKSSSHGPGERGSSW
jgi:heptosyltransferase III